MFVLAILVVVALLLPTAPAGAAGWLQPQDLGGPPEFSFSQPAVTITPDRDIVVGATVTGQNNNQALLYGARRAFGDFQFGNLAPAPSNQAVLATDSDGRVWTAVALPAGNGVALARAAADNPINFTDGAIFGVAASSAASLDLAVRPDEGALVYVDGGQVKLGRWTPAGGGTTTTIWDGADNGTPAAAKSARVTLDSAGNVTTLFQYLLQFNSCFIKARRVPAGAAPAGIENLGTSGNDDFGCGARVDVDLALGPTGRVMATWWDMTGTVERSLAAPGAAFGPSATIASAAFDATTNPEPLGNGGFDVHPRGLLGASDATLHTYVTRPPSSLAHISQRFDPAAGGPTIQPFEDGAATAELARNASEQAVGAWQAGGPPCHISVAFGTVGGGLSARRTLGPCGSVTSDPQVAIDPAGDAAAVWTADGTLWVAIYDAGAPLIDNVTVPATAGQTVAVSGSSHDALSRTTTNHWDFGDGTGADGTNARHAYAAPGRYTVTFTARDEAGNTASESHTVSIVDEALHPPFDDRTPPQITALSLAPATFRAASHGGSIAAAKVGTRISYRLSEAAQTTFTVERPASGRRMGRRCVAPTRANRHGRRCVRYRRLGGSFTQAGASGVNRLGFSGRLRGRKLAPGRYRLRLVARDAAGNLSTAATRRFGIVAR